MTCYNSELPIGPPGPVGPQGPPGPAGSGSGSSLTATLFIGNDTGGRDINLTSGDSLVVDSGSKLENGSFDNGFGGGISLICTNEKEQQWENGVRYLRPLGGTNVYAETLDNVNPNSTYDSTKQWAIGSRYKNLVTGIEYICTNANSGIWLPLSGTWTPNTSLLSALITDLTFGTSYYSVIGSIVTCMISGNATFNFNTFPVTTIGFSLTESPTGEQPFKSSFGIGTTTNPNVSVIVNGSDFNFIGNSGINESLNFIINFQYEIN